MSAGTLHMPMSAEATAPTALATVACAAAAGPAANGPMTGARKPKTPAKVSAAELRIERMIAAPCEASEAAAPACSKRRSRRAPLAVAAVLAASPASHCTTLRSLASMKSISRSRERLAERRRARIPCRPTDPRNCELKAPVTASPNCR